MDPFAPAEAPPTPVCRATIVGTTITLNQWSPSLMSGGPSRAVLRTVATDGTCLVDLAFETDDDGRSLIVTAVPGHDLDTDQRHAIIEWATATGYRRVWFDDDVIEIDLAAVEPGTPAACDCPTCHARWDDDSHTFWTAVRSRGHFPGSCPACGGSLPEWDVALAPASATDPALRTKDDELTEVQA